MLVFAGAAFALPVTQQEIFLGTTSDGEFVDVLRGQSVNFSFDFVNLNSGFLKPIIDEAGFIPDSVIVSAILGVTISSNNSLLKRIVISSGKYDNGIILANESVSLEGTSTGRQSKSFNVDLLAAGLEGCLKDGMFQVNILAPNLFGNNFRIEQMFTTVATAAPVPESSTMALFSCGLLGFVVVAKRRQAVE